MLCCSAKPILLLGSSGTPSWHFPNFFEVALRWDSCRLRCGCSFLIWVYVDASTSFASIPESSFRCKIPEGFQNPEMGEDQDV